MVSCVASVTDMAGPAGGWCGRRETYTLLRTYKLQPASIDVHHAQTGRQTDRQTDRQGQRDREREQKTHAETHILVSLSVG